MVQAGAWHGPYVHWDWDYIFDSISLPAQERKPKTWQGWTGWNHWGWHVEGTWKKWEIRHHCRCETREGRRLEWISIHHLSKYIERFELWTQSEMYILHLSRFFCVKSQCVTCQCSFARTVLLLVHYARSFLPQGWSNAYTVAWFRLYDRNMKSGWSPSTIR